MVGEKKLRPYQRRAVTQLRNLFQGGERRCAFVSPTGSGKSITVTALITALCRNHVFSSVVVSVPMIHVQSSFSDIGKIRCGREVFDTSTLWTHVSGSGATSRLCRALETPETFATVVTHQGLVGPSLDCIRKADLSSRLLVIDEGHHASNDKDLNRLSEARELWLERGGSVLVVTATPYRHDRTPVVDDSWARVERSLIDHVTDNDGPWCPRKLEVRTSILEGFRPKTREALHDSSRKGVRARRKFTDKIVQRWHDDSHHSKRPKMIIIVPAFASQSWVREIIKSFEARGLDRSRILDATGTSLEDQRRTRAILDAEREVKRWRDSTVDIIIACKRFDEASDWPLASHVYVIGYARSIPLTLQRWGRTFRDKSTIAGHPFSEKASITFFIPEWSKELLVDAGESGALSKYRDDAHLLACCLHDFTTGLEYAHEGANMREQAKLRDSAGSFDPIERATAMRDVDRVRAHTKGLKALVAGLCGLPKARAVAALAVLSERVARRSLADRKLVQDAWDEVAAKTANAPKYDRSLVRTAMLSTFRAALTSTGRNTIPFDAEHLTLVADFTGQDVETVTRALVEYQDRARNLARLNNEVQEFVAHHGRAPYNRENRRWSAWCSWLARHHDTTLTRHCASLGYAGTVNRTDRSEASFKQEIKTWLAAGNRWPTKRTSTEWDAWDCWLRANTNKTLATCQPGYTAPTRRSMSSVVAKIQSWHKDTGSPPQSNDSNHWTAINQWLVKYHATTLHKLCVSLGLKEKYTRRSMANFDRCFNAYVQRNGHAPGKAVSIDWRKWDAWLRHNHGESLEQRAHRLGIITYRNRRNRQLSQLVAQLQLKGHDPGSD